MPGAISPPLQANVVKTVAGERLIAGEVADVSDMYMALCKIGL